MKFKHANHCEARRMVPSSRNPARLKHALAAVSVVGLLGASVSASAQTAPPTATTSVGELQPIQNVWTDMVLAIKHGTDEPAGTEVIQWWDPGAAAQLDQLWTADLDYWVTLQNAGTQNGFALTVNGNSSNNGAPMIQWWVTASNEYQQWHLDPVYDAFGYQVYRDNPIWGFQWAYHIINRATKKCLALPGTQGGTVKPGAGVQVIQWQCGNGLDQQWWFGG